MPLAAPRRVRGLPGPIGPPAVAPAVLLANVTWRLRIVVALPAASSTLHAQQMRPVRRQRRVEGQVIAQYQRTGLDCEEGIASVARAADIPARSTPALQKLLGDGATVDQEHRLIQSGARIRRREGDIPDAAHRPPGGEASAHIRGRRRGIVGERDVCGIQADRHRVAAADRRAGGAITAPAGGAHIDMSRATQVGRRHFNQVCVRHRSTGISHFRAALVAGALIEHVGRGVGVFGRLQRGQSRVVTRFP